ncbi:MAG: hypothetical protein KME17_03290 [Cyanosarcina radialis HA8281-LM2]|jgi:hypothetical protein|nr:hypothetical protein [Cyanosarcina radialis HA8281-LM2]
MSKLPSALIANVLDLQIQLLECLDESTKTIFDLLEQYGETEATIPELDELESIREKANTYYSRFHTTLRQIYECQPIASHDILELLARYISESEAVVDATVASIQEIKKNWNLP